MQLVRTRLLSAPAYFIYWLLFFQFGRFLFLILTYAHASEYSPLVWSQIAFHGLWLDASMAGYFTLFYSLLCLISLWMPALALKFFKVAHILLLSIATLAVLSHSVLYTYWSSPLDYHALTYLKNPSEAAASINWMYMLLPLVMGFGVFISFKYLFEVFLKKISFERISELRPLLINTLMMLVLALLCVIPIRGGTGLVPVNLSYVYFHKDIYPNHAAYNPVWNVLYSYMEMSNEDKYVYMGDKEAEKTFKVLFSATGQNNEAEQLVKSRPNIVVIVLESFLSKLVDHVYKGKEVVPNLNAYCKEGVYFKNFYSSGDRSDKGLPSIFSGYPAMPKSALVQFPEKFTRLPSLFKDAGAVGYSTSFYYGGNLEFANLKSYFIATGAQKMITEKHIKGKVMKGKWGVHDAHMFDRLYSDLVSMKKPFFTSLFTLSNHEPFDIPEEYVFGKSNGDEEYMSAAHYTDKYLGKFIDRLKQSEVWENTLVVLLADHGVTRMGVNTMYQSEKYHIPMVWIGGAVLKTQVISKIASQVDVPLMINSQCQWKPAKPYKFSNNVLGKGNKGFAMYFFNNGFGYLSDSCITQYDHVSGQYFENSCGKEGANSGKAYLQILSKDFNN